MATQAFAKPAVLPSENLAEYEGVLATLQAEFVPETATESFLVEEMARAQWKMRRFAVMEQELLSGGASLTESFKEDCAKHGALLKLNRHEESARRAWYKALTELLKLRANQTLLRNRAFEAQLQQFMAAPPPSVPPRTEKQVVKAKPMPLYLEAELERHKRRDPLFDPKFDRSQMSKQLQRWFDEANPNGAGAAA